MLNTPVTELRRGEAPPGQVSQAQNPVETDDLSPSDVLLAIWERKFLVAMIVLAAAVAGHFYAKSETRIYTARADIMLNLAKDGGDDVTALVTGISGDWREIETQLQLILSRNLIGATVDALNLTETPEYNPWLAAQQVQEPVVALPGWLSLPEWLERRVPAGIPFVGRVREDVVPPQAPPQDEIRRYAIRKLIRQTRVEQSGDSLIIYLSVATPDPALSARLANAIAEQYIVNQIALKFEAAEKAAAWLSNRVVELRAAVEAADSAIAEFRAESELVNDDQLAALGTRLLSLRQTRREVVDLRDAARQRLAEIDALLSGGRYAEVADTAAAPGLEALAGAIENASTADARTAATARFQSELDGVTERLRREVAQSEKSIGRLNEMLAEIENRQSREGAARVRLAQLVREAEAARAIYETFLNREKESSIQQGTQSADAVVIAEAWAPDGPSYPQPTRILLISTAIGLLIACGAAVGLQVMRQIFSEPEELEAYTGRRILGLIPRFRMPWGMTVLDYVSSQPNSPFVEAVRNLRTSLQFTMIDSPSKVVAIGSSVEGEGKSTLTLALGQVAGTQANSRVLVLDCDLRRHRASSVLKGHGMPGVTAYVGGEAQLDDIILRPQQANFDVIFADRAPKITADIFASRRFAELIDELRDRYDLIIIDTPPVLALTDARIIMSHVNLAVFTVNWKKTRRRPLRAALRSLEISGVEKVALIFNRTNIRKSVGYYGKRYYGHK